MQIVTDKNKVALYFKDNAVSYKEFILNTKKQRNKPYEYRWNQKTSCRVRWRTGR